MSFIQRIMIALLFSLILSIFPLPKALSIFQPQLVLLVFLYLQLFANTYFYVSLLLFVGMLLDLMHANLLGQHALPILITCLVMVKRCRRFQFFSYPQQVLTIFFLTLLNNMCFSLIGWVYGNPTPWIPLFTGAFSTAACWPLLRFYFGQLRV